MRILVILFQASIHKTFAQGAWGIYCDALGTYCGNGRLYIISLAARLIDAVIIPLIGGIAVIGIIWAGIKMTASFGNDQGKEDAKKIIGYSIIGIVLSVAGFAIVNWACRFAEFSTGGSGFCG